MERRRRRTVISAAMVVLGLVQAVWGALQSEVIYSLLGSVYAFIGIAYFWAEVYRVDEGRHMSGR